MNKTTILNILGAVLAGVVLTTLFMGRSNQALATRVNEYQSRLNEGRQAETILKQLAVRLAQTADQDPEMRKVMTRHGLKATLTVDGKKKEFP